MRVKASKPTALRDLAQNTTSLPCTHCTRPLKKKNLSTIHPIQIHASSCGDARQPSIRITWSQWSQYATRKVSKASTLTFLDSNYRLRYAGKLANLYPEGRVHFACFTDTKVLAFLVHKYKYWRSVGTPDPMEAMKVDEIIGLQVQKYKNWRRSKYKKTCKPLSARPHRDGML